MANQYNIAFILFHIYIYKVKKTPSLALESFQHGTEVPI
jgi:hypothetical protein